MPKNIFCLFLIVGASFFSINTANARTSTLILDNLSKTTLSKFDCNHAVSDPQTFITSIQDNAVIPNNYYYPIIDWEGPEGNHDVYLIELASRHHQTDILLKQNRWQPSGDEFKPFLKEKEVQVALYRLHQGKTYKTKTFRLVIANHSLNDQIVFRMVQPLFNPFLPNSIKIFSFDQKSLSSLVELKETCIGCHGYSANLAAFNTKKNKDRRLLTLKQVNHTFQLNHQAPGEFSFLTISPDGKYIVFVIPVGKLDVKKTYSEPFDYPYTAGDLYCYDVVKKTSAPLKGASDPKWVEDMPSFTPDGKFILFSRYRYEKSLWKKGVYAMDLYRVPFNNGRGGTPLPVQNASANHKVQYFARTSPNGKWISFCRGDGQKGIYARKSSDIYLLSVKDNQCVKLNLNADNGMDSWHDWSSDSHWLIFSSNREKSEVTALYLAYIDENGRDAPPVKIVSDPLMKVNTPQFVSKNFNLRTVKHFGDDIDRMYSKKK